MKKDLFVRYLKSDAYRNYLGTRVFSQSAKTARTSARGGDLGRLRRKTDVKARDVHLNSPSGVSDQMYILGNMLILLFRPFVSEGSAGSAHIVVEYFSSVEFYVRYFQFSFQFFSTLISVLLNFNFN